MSVILGDTSSDQSSSDAAAANLGTWFKLLHATSCYKPAQGAPLLSGHNDNYSTWLAQIGVWKTFECCQNKCTLLGAAKYTEPSACSC